MSFPNGRLLGISLQIADPAIRNVEDFKNAFVYSHANQQSWQLDLTRNAFWWRWLLFYEGSDGQMAPVLWVVRFLGFLQCTGTKWYTHVLCMINRHGWISFWYWPQLSRIQLPACLWARHGRSVIQRRHRHLCNDRHPYFFGETWICAINGFLD